jgi:hypothetical protein
MEGGNMKNRPYFARCHHAFAILLLLLCRTSQASAADVSLAWDPSVSPNIAGYRVYFGNGSHTYGNPITIGNQTTYTVTGLTNGNYYFAVTAFDTNGVESDFSNEISTLIGSSGNKCNLNGDASVNAIDLQLLANVILGIGPTSGSYDLNGDGRVDVLDLQILNNVILGLRSCP